jgi:hypothetical protein
LEKKMATSNDSDAPLTSDTQQRVDRDEGGRAGQQPETGPDGAAADSTERRRLSR